MSSSILRLLRGSVNKLCTPAWQKPKEMRKNKKTQVPVVGWLLYPNYFKQEGIYPGNSQALFGL
jgi:hypothetical protein